MTPTELTDQYEFYVNGIVDAHCPVKTSLVHPDDHPYITVQLKALKRRIMREFESKGKYDNYFEMKTELKEKVVNEAIKYKEKIMAGVTDGSYSSTYKALCKLGVRPGK